MTGSNGRSDNPPTPSGPARRTTTRFTFRRIDRIPEGEDFVGTVRRGKRVVTKHLRFMFRPNGRSASRLGVSVGRKFGRAVARNRFKRLAREAFRCDDALRAAGLDVVIVAQNGAALRSPEEIAEGLRTVLARAAKPNERTTRE